MAPVDQPTVAERLAKESGIELKDGRWEPKRFLEQQGQMKTQQEKNVQDRKNLLIGTVFLTLIVLFIVVPLIVLLPPAYASCLPTILFVLVFVIIFLWVTYASGGMADISQGNLKALYPVVEVHNGNVFLDKVPVDYSHVDLCQLDRVMDEFRIIDTEWKRKVLYIRSYEDPNGMSAALKAAFEVHGVRVDERQLDQGDPHAIARISQGQSVTDQTEATIEQRKRIVEAQLTLEEERKRQLEERIASKGPEAPIPARTQPTGPGPSAGSTCRKCGALLSEDLIECPRCGTAI
jgi:hypothetical protein